VWPNCRTEMIYVAALPHPNSPTMRKTTFVCYGCNQTRNYALSEEMDKAYVASHGDPLLTINTEPEATLTSSAVSLSLSDFSAGAFIPWRGGADESGAAKTVPPALM
jgi:hypothetical protein